MDEEKPGRVLGWEDVKKPTWWLSDTWDPNVALLSLWMKMIIAHGGSSSPGLYISHTGVVGAPYSGRTHPGHPASLKASAYVDRH